MRVVLAIAIAFITTLPAKNVNATVALRGVDNVVGSETRQLAEMSGSGSTSIDVVDGSKTSLEELGNKNTYGKQKKCIVK
ncbi:hypothetical protein BBO99_00003907 [Phytophthora kernoviae]|uniref:RxLR effector protein n=2 Tax=Phytophthora kernoviae TaxID=325452 RepID=A0A3R7H440_9STRA|nr:hypothetical protein G195_010327 [Phytophthora kernoviae 00238/432]KAG2511612.1 hypothetical protein JM18_008675 [Phytophthora kernoviae]KAG2521516.1 hypothetical protein JM16_003546 [Phytophthora kernoviae]RLN15007.1 hypothetical protein BBI17_003931 [Phytophthora kernoviae]RLN81194.1 hypothetical protein BBO99_00003907 [Phytophthora kernoviae]